MRCLIEFMPNQRREGQTFIGCQADESLVVDLDRARGYKDRSQFIREAIAEKLNRMGYQVRQSVVYPPPRAKARTKSNVVQIGVENHNETTQTARVAEKVAEKKPKRRK